jgi:hypothetical protein
MDNLVPFPLEAETYLLASAVRTTMAPTQPPIEGAPGTKVQFSSCNLNSGRQTILQPNPIT